MIEKNAISKCPHGVPYYNNCVFCCTVIYNKKNIDFFDKNAMRIKKHLEKLKNAKR